MTPNPRHEVSVLRSLAKMNLGSLFWPEGCLALVIGVGGGIALLNVTGVADRIAIVGDALPVLSVLLGVVFAAFTLMFTLFTDEYVRLLNQAKDGVKAFIRPFGLAIGCEITALLLSVGYRAAADHVDSKVEVGVFLAWGFLFTFSLLDVAALARNVSLHGITRARQITARLSDDVTPIEQRRRSAPK